MLAAKNGVPEALYRLGKAYMVGYGVKKDTVKAILCWNEAEDAGHVKAHADLELMRNGAAFVVYSQHLPFPMSALDRPASRIFDICDTNADILSASGMPM
jgi:TPR repeat protein